MGMEMSLETFRDAWRIFPRHFLREVLLWNVRLVFALFPLLFLGSPVYAQSPCSECLKAAQEELNKCLDNAISADDKISCDESQQAQTKACVNGECKIERIERDERNNRNEPQTPSRPGPARPGPARPHTLHTNENRVASINREFPASTGCQRRLPVFTIRCSIRSRDSLDLRSVSHHCEPRNYEQDN